MIGPTSIAEKLRLAISHLQAGQPQQAEPILRQILADQPNHPEALHQLGLLKLRAGKFDEAADFLGSAAHADAKNPAYACDWGVALSNLGKLDLAVEAYRRSIALRDDNAAVFFNLATTLRNIGQLDPAIDAFSRSIALNPKSAPAHNMLGNIFRKKGDFPRAIDAFRNALAVKPDHKPSLLGLGFALNEAGRDEESEQVLRRAVQTFPDFTDAWIALGRIMKDAGRMEQSISDFRAALATQPNAPVIHGAIAYCVYFDPDATSEKILAECRDWYDRHGRPLRTDIRPHENDRSPDRRLRIGYVSPDFRIHAQTLFTLPLLSNHDRKNFEIFCYSDVEEEDEMTARLRAQADHWRPIRGIGDEQLAAAIRADRIDILVDLTMHMNDNRLRVFSMKPAPVQLTWLAYPGTTGVETIDYRLTDPHLDPPPSTSSGRGENDAHYVEKSIPLPDTFWCFDPVTDEAAVNPLPAATNGLVTFGCLNNPCKINDQTLALWSQVLRRVPNSRLIVLAAADSLRKRIVNKLGITADRIEFVPFQARVPYLLTHHRIDLGLDAFPYNGHTTSLDSMWMGVPVISLCGTLAVSRAGLSQMTNVGLAGDFVARSPEQFVELAVKWAGDLAGLSELRKTLRGRMKKSPLMDGPKFARGMEQIFLNVWREWCEKPQIPDSPDDLAARADKLKDDGLVPEAMDCLARAIALRPDDAATRSASIYTAHFDPRATPRTIFELAQAWDDRHGKPRREEIRPHENDRSPDRRLRIGYVSGDFYRHAETFFTIPLLGSHDRSKFEIFCYSHVMQEDDATQIFRGYADHWRITNNLSDEQVAEMVRADQIDILMDLSMHMVRNRLITFALKPAPIQFTWLAYPGTTGVSAIDYRLTDRWMDPIDQPTPFYSEQSIRLPDCWVCYSPLSDVPFQITRAPGPIRFGSLNNPCKHNEPTLDVWFDAMRQIPDSRLILAAYSQEHRSRILDFARARQINADRIEFVGRLKRDDYLRAYDRIDIALDTLPYNGITTTCDALLRGAPVITLAGDAAHGRAGVGILMTAGLPELVARSGEQFTQIARDLAADPVRLAEYRRTIRDRMRDSPLADCERFARNFEREYRAAWNRWCAGSLNPDPAPDPPLDPSLDPPLDPVDQWIDTAIALKDAGKVTEAIGYFRKAVAARPLDTDLHGGLAYHLHFDPASTPEDILRENLNWDRIHGIPLRSRIQPHANDRTPDRRLRIGYVAPDFRKHCQTFFTYPLLRSHDRDAFEIFCYSGVQTEDEATAALRQCASVWRRTVGWNDDKLAEQIRADQIDILVDLTLHMSGCRLKVFAQKPAPVQISWLAYPGTTGLSAMDFRLTDPFLDPPGNDRFYAEKSIRLPESFWCYDPLTDEPVVNKLPALANGFVTFGCLNAFWKTNEDTLKLWAEVMHRIPDSRLVLMAPAGEPRERVLRTMGIDPSRVQFVPHQARDVYLATYHRIDLGLDTYPYNGHTTSFDSIWMGVPVISRRGEIAVRRAGFCQAANLGLTDELIADTPDQFIDLAAQLAGNLSRLSELRRTLRDRLGKSPLMDAPRFARNIETVYRDLWRKWCAEKS